MLTRPCQPPPRPICTRLMRLFRVTAKHKVTEPGPLLETDRLSVLRPILGLTTLAIVPAR
jgi:hypothetical protein